jgi:hypothetical protein
MRHQLEDTVRRIVRFRSSAIIAAIVAAGVFGSGVQPAFAQSVPQVVASGLDNPRGLAFGPDGALYVVEAGRGGSSTLCLPNNETPGGPDRCYGPSGAVTRIANGRQERVVSGLPSLAPPGGTGATGPQDIDFGLGAAWVTIGFGGAPAQRAPFVAAGVNLGWLARISLTGEVTYIVDFAAAEGSSNPDGGAIDSNPYGVKILADRALVTDAGANALWSVALNGQVSTAAVFPARIVTGPFGAGVVPMQAVPTSVTVGKDGNYYVGELTGFPFPVGAARVYRVSPTGGAPTIGAEGFTNLIDVVIDANGVGYALEHDSDGLFAPAGPRDAGRLVRVGVDGTRTVLTTELTRPGGIAIGPDGAIYISNRSVLAGTGEVLRIVP